MEHKNLVYEYSKADICINFSTFEGGPQTFAESALCSVPMLIRDNIPLSEKIPCFTGKTEEDFINIIEYLKLNREKCIEIGERARQAVINNFTYKKTAKKFADFFLKLNYNDNKVNINNTIDIFESQKIPKIIHQIWIGPYKPPEFMYTWKEIHADYEYILWDNNKIKELFPLRNQELYDLYDGETECWNARSDILRFEIMHKFGGIYVDADTICLRHLEGDFLNTDFFAAYLNEKARKNRIASGVMGGVKNHILMERCIEELHKYEKVMRPAHTYVGPTFFTYVINKYQIDIKILPSYYFYPHFLNDKDNADYNGDFKPFGNHVWGTTKKLYGKI